MARVKSAVVCESHAQISGADDANAMNDVKTQNFAQVFSQLGNVVSNTAERRTPQNTSGLFESGGVQLNCWASACDEVVVTPEAARRFRQRR